MAATNTTVSTIDGKARRSGRYQRLSRSGTPSFRPTANSEMSSAISAIFSRSAECRSGSGAMSAHPAGPSA